jgi:hypothetical protein
MQNAHFWRYFKNHICVSFCVAWSLSCPEGRIDDFHLKNRQKLACYFIKFKLCLIVDDYVTYRLCKFQVKIFIFECVAIF